jgi:hypothetical protein
LVREDLHAFSVIPARYEHVPIWRTHGRYRKQMKRGYCKVLYNQRNKDETIMSVIKRLFGEHITSRLVRTQNRELSFRCIAYNMHRLTNITIITWFLLSHTWTTFLACLGCGELPFECSVRSFTSEQPYHLISTVVASSCSVFVGFFFGMSTCNIPLLILALTFEDTISSGTGILW